MAVIFLFVGVALLVQGLGAQSAWWTVPRASLCLCLGWLFWSLLEYFLHRYILHGTRSLAQQGHAHHHRDEVALLASPLFAIPMFEVLLWTLLSLSVGPMFAAFSIAGAASGYASFSLLHHVFHHSGSVRDGTAWGPLVRLRANHEVHHRRARWNFGTTTSLWDRVFGTYRPQTQPQSR